MAFADQALLSQDLDFQQRLTACAAGENIGDTAPTAWAATFIWNIAAAPGLGDKYASALASGVERPGWDASVISDGDILSAVQSFLGDAT